MEILDYNVCPHFVSVFEEVQFGQLHLVTPAWPLLVLRNVTEVLPELPSDQRWPFIRKVNEANDKNNALTLYPSARMSLIPLTKFEERDDFGLRQEMYRHIEYILRVNEEEAKCPDILFDLDINKEFDGRLALEVLSEILAENRDFKLTRRVFVLPEDFDGKIKLEKF